MRYLAIVIFLFFSQALNAQISSRDGFMVGGNLGIGTSWILNQNAFELLRKTCEDQGLWGSEPDYQITIGYGGGASAGFQSNDFWGAVIELNYAKAGQKYKDSFTTTICPDHSNFARNFSLHYLQVPILAKFTATHRRDTKWYVLVGPQFGLLLGAKETVTIGNSEQPEGTFTPVKEKVKTLDFGFTLDTGADIFLADNLFIKVGFRAYIGVLDINGEAVQDFISQNDASYQASRNFSAGVHVGVNYIFDWVGSFYR